MRSTTLLPTRFSAALLGLAVAAAPVAARAQVNFVGTTAATFNGGTNSIGGLTIANGTFNVTTNSAGFAAIGGQGTNLGVASLTNQVFNYTGTTLALRVTFSAPGGATSQTFTSVLQGAVEANNVGGVRIAFTPATLSGTFDSGRTYTLSIDNISLTPGQTGVEVTGAITASAIPEPSTYALMGMGLAGLVGAASLRRRGSTAA